MRDKTTSKINPQSARMTPEDWEFEGSSGFSGFASQINLILKKLEEFSKGKQEDLAIRKFE